MESLIKLGFSQAKEVHPLIAAMRVPANPVQTQFKNHNQSLSRAMPAKRVSLEDSVRQASPTLHGLYRLAKDRKINIGKKGGKWGRITAGKIGKAKIESGPLGIRPKIKDKSDLDIYGIKWTKEF